MIGSILETAETELCAGDGLRATAEKESGRRVDQCIVAFH